MYESVAAYLAEQREKKAEQQARKREEKLIKLGLYREEYLPEATEITTELVKEYPCRDEDGKRYKKVPLPVTEEEWAELCRNEEPPSAGRRSNPVRQVLVVIAVLFYVGGFFTGVLSAGYMRSYGIYGESLIQAVSIWFTAAAAGTVFLALSEIIRLLDK